MNFIFEAFNDVITENETNNVNQNDMLDIVGRGYLASYGYDANFGHENYEQNQTPEVLKS